MSDKTNNNGVYSQDVLEFVTVAAELCVRLEQAQSAEMREFVPAMLKILPLLYVKAMVLHESIEETDAFLEESVEEEDYNFVRASVASVMGSHDDYLDVFVEDMKYSDQPIRKTISEDLADIYQDLRNFIDIYRGEFEDAMQAALSRVIEQFPTYWGQKVTCVLRALHDVMFQQEIEELND